MHAETSVHSSTCEADEDAVWYRTPSGVLSRAVKAYLGTATCRWGVISPSPIPCIDSCKSNTRYNSRGDACDTCFTYFAQPLSNERCIHKYKGQATPEILLKIALLLYIVID